MLELLLSNSSSFDLSFFWVGFLHVGFWYVFLNLVVLVWAHFFRIQKPLSLVQKPILVPRTHFTHFKIGYCIIIKFYYKFKF